MRTTQDIVDALSTNLAPVRRQASPIMRTLLWLALAALVIGLLALVHGLRPNLFTRATELPFQLEVIGALLTGMLAAFAAFVSGIPGRSKWWMALPLPVLALWMAVIGQPRRSDAAAWNLCAGQPRRCRHCRCGHVAHACAGRKCDDHSV
jgi:hypothetical protein